MYEREKNKVLIFTKIWIQTRILNQNKNQVMTEEKQKSKCWILWLVWNYKLLRLFEFCFYFYFFGVGGALGTNTSETTKVVSSYWG